MTDDHISQLESENARLRSMLARHGVLLLPAVDLPSDAEVIELLSMVVREYPALHASSDDDAIRAVRHDQFRRAVHYLAFARRTPEPNTTYAALFWMDACREWLAGQCYPNTISLSAFTAAVVACKVPYAPLDSYPRDLTFGLSLGGATTPSVSGGRC